MRALRPILFVALSVAAAAAAQANPYVYTDWTGSTSGPSGSADGTITLPDATVISVHYSGQVAFAQTAGGTNYWVPNAPYLSAQVSNAPTDPDIVTISEVTRSTVTFSQAVTNPIMPIVSLGQPSLPVSYAFDAPFTILSQGTGFWGGGPTSLTQSGNTLTGAEGHGTIMFIGSYTSISWDTSPAENWHGHTWGVEAVPEPATMAALAVGTLGLLRRRKK